MINPVLRREMRAAMRSWKTYIVIMIYVLVLVGVAGVITFISNAASNSFEPVVMMAMNITLLVFQNLLVAIITPAFTCGAISGEKERQTLDIMLLTKMSTFQIVIGKLTSSLLNVFLIIIASMPVFGLMMFYGSISLVQMLAMVGFTVLMAAAIGSVSIMFSSIFKRTIAALVIVFILLLTVTMGNFFIAFITIMLSSFYPSAELSLIITKFILSSNPIIGFISVIDAQYGTNYANDTVYSMISTMSRSGYVGFTNTTLQKMFDFFNNIPLWVFNVIWMVIVIFVSIAISSRLVRPTKSKAGKKG